jgi:hypothetical protein
MPELEEAWRLARDKPAGTTKFLSKYAAFSRPVIDEWGYVPWSGVVSRS